MKSMSIRSFACAALLLAASLAVHAQQTPPDPPPQAAPPATQPEPEVELEREAPASDDEAPLRWSTRDDNVIVHIGEDAHLAKDDRADVVVSVFGSAIAEGDVHDAVVAVFGDAHARGRVGQSVVAAFGNAYVDERVGDQAVAVLGDVTLGPNAEVDGDVVTVGGRVIRDPGSVIHGGVREIAIAGGYARVEWLRAWIHHCLLYGRPLAIEPHLGWAWGIAFAFLAFYVLLGVLFGSGIDRCVRTLETRPGESLLAALLSVLAAPVLVVLLLITVIGIMFIPFFGLALFAAGLFGKAVVFAWIGRRVTHFTGVGQFAQVAFPVLVGGLIMMAVYLVPILGFVAYKVAGILGMGVVIYTILLALQAKRATAAPALAGASSASPIATAPTESVGEPAGPPPQPAPPLTNGAAAPRAGFWIRMAALFIDVVLVTIVVSILQAPDEIWLIALAGYGALMWKLKGSTVGGTVCHLQVVRVDGRDIEWDTALVRALSCFLSLAVAGLGFIWIAFDADRQAWHDKIAGTVVVRLPRPVPAVQSTQ